MVKRYWQKAFVGALALSFMVTNVQIANAAGDNTAVVEEQENDITEEKQEAEETDPENGDRANSWRYKDGEPIPQRLRYTQYSTWPDDVEGAVAYGIDVSSWQGDIDWTKVKAAGVDYAIVRCGYGQNQEDQDDEYWYINADACVENGIPFGTYLYSYADTVAKAKSEAQHVLRLVEGYDLSYPIYYDMEEDSVREKLSTTEIADIAQAFCDIIEDAGYEVAIYANTDWFTNYLTDSRFAQWDKWVAQYNTTCTYTGDYSMWQCSSQGKVDGITGNADLNVDLGAGIGITGFGQDPDTQEWYYYRNGKPAIDLTDVIKGTVNGTNAWWNVVKGKVTYDDTVAKNSKGWWVIRDGKVDFSYTGFAENSKGWWYCEEGKVQFGVDDVIKGTVNGENGWWYVVGGEVTFTETVAKNSKGWWHIQNGKVNFNSNTVAKNSKGWWVICDGKVDFDYEGFAENKNGWWYCEGGKVQFGTSSVIKGTVNGKKAWWHVVDGEMTADNTIAKNSKGWWVIRDGKVDFSYTGFAENKNGWWYCKDGKVQFDTNSVIKGTVNGEKAWWHVVGGKVTFDNTVAKNSKGWWHIQKGKVNFDSNTVAKNSNGWWVIRNGKVDFNFNGIAGNANGEWLCQKGKVNFDYSGTYKYGGHTYTIKNGKVA